MVGRRCAPPVSTGTPRRSEVPPPCLPPKEHRPDEVGVVNADQRTGKHKVNHTGMSLYHRTGRKASVLPKRPSE